MQRSTSLDRIRSATEPFDILVVGGGATGLGAAVDAAARGHRVALVEQHDFAKGTSSRSTKLVHGGVRYLRQGNISLVLEALRERGRLARNAPHLVHDLAFVIPSYKWWEGPFYGVGMKVYDQLAGKLGLKPSRLLDLRGDPGADPDGRARAPDRGGRLPRRPVRRRPARGQPRPDRRRARGGGPQLLPAASGSLRRRTSSPGSSPRDQETGEEFDVRARAVINATGVFVDDARAARTSPTRRRLVAVSQGDPSRPAEGVPAGRDRDHDPEDRRRPGALRGAVARPGRRRHDRHAACRATRSSRGRSTRSGNS